MKIAVAGLWHLGCVTAACLAQAGHSVLGYDPDAELIAELQQARAPLFEPGLNELLTNAIQTQTIQFSIDLAELNQAEIVWITFDTPVDENDQADVVFVINEIKKIFPVLAPNTLVIISSQLPVGSTQALQFYCHKHFPDKNISFAYSPENLRLGKAIEVFTKPDRVVVGLQDPNDKNRIQALLQTFTNNIIWMKLESAEMTKHAINAFLATSVVFANELANLCEYVGADASEVERGLKSEERIGPKAYLRAGGAIGGGTLLRDINYLIHTGKNHHTSTSFFEALLASNEAHKKWLSQKLLAVFKNLRDKTIVALGLTYKAGTDTLRRSTAIELCEWLKNQGAKILAFDPSIKQLPNHLAEFIHIQPTLQQALQGADAIVITTQWPEFISITGEQLLQSMATPRVFDANAFLQHNLKNDPRIHYYSVGHHYELS